MTRITTKTDDDKHTRYLQLQEWVTAALSAGKLQTGRQVTLDAISGDAGFRRYYRLAGSTPALLAVDAPPETEKNHAFCHIAQLFRQYGIHAPQVYAVDYTRGFMLIEDMGDLVYWPLLTGQSHHALYDDAAQCLLKMQSIPCVDAGLTMYDAEKLQQEMDLFPEWFVKKLLQTEMTSEAAGMLQHLNRQLVNNAITQPQVVVHRDFHCRNLLFVANNNPGVIDFQDAVIGAVTYDLVSLYRDCYIRWPEAQVTQWVLQYREKLLQRNIIAFVPEETFLKWFDWMGLQRHIKVLGIFARLYLRDHKPGYLNDLPLVIHYTLSVAKRYAECTDFVLWFERELLPRAKKCEWYREIEK